MIYFSGSGTTTGRSLGSTTSTGSRPKATLFLAGMVFYDERRLWEAGGGGWVAYVSSPLPTLPVACGGLFWLRGDDLFSYGERRFGGRGGVWQFCFYLYKTRGVFGRGEGGRVCIIPRLHPPCCLVGCFGYKETSFLLLATGVLEGGVAYAPPPPSPEYGIERRFLTLTLILNRFEQVNAATVEMPLCVPVDTECKYSSTALTMLFFLSTRLMPPLPSF